MLILKRDVGAIIHVIHAWQLQRIPPQDFAWPATWRRTWTCQQRHPRRLQNLLRRVRHRGCRREDPVGLEEMELQGVPDAR